MNQPNPLDNIPDDDPAVFVFEDGDMLSPRLVRQDDQLSPDDCELLALACRERLHAHFEMDIIDQVIDTIRMAMREDVNNRGSHAHDLNEWQKTRKFWRMVADETAAIVNGYGIEFLPQIHAWDKTHPYYYVMHDYVEGDSADFMKYTSLEFEDAAQDAV